MLYLKEANFDDIKKEYETVSGMKPENGFSNPDYECSFEAFEKVVLPGFINSSKGIGLKEGHVPDTQYFLWDDEKIVGWFRFRHYLNDFLLRGAGHIGYAIVKEFRGKGYASKGLTLMLNIVRDAVLEDEIYLSVNKSNPASLKVMLNNGAYIHHEDENEYYTRIKK